MEVTGAHAQLSLGAPTATFVAGSVTTITIPSITPKGGAALPVGTTVQVQYETGAGVAIGAPVNVTLGPGGVLTVPPPPIPAGAAPLGNRLVVNYDLGGGTFISSKPVIWWNSGLIWKTPKIKIDPLGLPGLSSSSQSWFLQDAGSGLEMATTAPDGSSIDGQVASSNFDLQYTDMGGGQYSAQIAGDHSFIRLNDGTDIAFANGSNFGTLQYTSNDGTNAAGTFNFGAIGAIGSWAWNIGTDYTGAITTDLNGFNAPAITVSTSAPEPSTIALLCTTGLLAAFRLRRRRRRSV